MPLVDLHCHLLPGVDDGPGSMDDTIAYARRAVAAGTRTIVATPHVEQVQVAELPERVRAVREALAGEGIALEVEVGGELKPASVPALSDAELETIAHGPAGARWVLYEAPFSGIDDDFAAGAAELADRGYGLLIAHPERSRGLLVHGLELLAPVLDRGALLEVNVGPLTGMETTERTEAAHYLVDRGQAHVVATDAHPPRRPYLLGDARGLVPDAALDAAPARLLTEGLTPRPAR